ncbi:MAG: DUF1592 domain-containing protein [Pseudomonadota bacterium]
MAVGAAAAIVLAAGCTATVGTGGSGGGSGSGAAPGSGGPNGPGGTSGTGAPSGADGSVPDSGALSPPSPQTETIGTVGISTSPNKAIARLTNSQFVHSAAVLVGGPAVAGIESMLPEQDIQEGLYRNTGFAQQQQFSVVQAYDGAASAIVARITDWPAFHRLWGGCTQQTCIKTFIRAFAEAAFRRPVTDEDVNAFQPIVDAGVANMLNYDDTVQLIVRATLQSPDFLYLFFDQSLTDFQLASRLSYFITDGPPDAELRTAAKGQLLRTPAGLNQQIDRLLGNDLTAFAQAFAYDYLVLRKATTRNVNQTDNSTPVDPATVVQFMASAVDSFASLVDRDQPIGSILTTETFVVNDTTASWLAGAKSAEKSAETMMGPTARYPFMGMLTHPATLIAISNAVFGSTVSRGQFIASQMLCVPPAPPPTAGAQSVDLSAKLPPNPTARDYGEARMGDPRCGGCHAQFESYSFALTKWGGDGLYKDDPRFNDAGPIKTGLGDITFDGYKTFLPKLAGSTQFQRCVTDHVVRYGLQHTEYPPELVPAVLAAAQGTNATITFRSLIRGLVRQPIFTTR